MPVLLFHSQFVPAVERGSKPHTIRPERKRPIRVGDRLSLRCWMGKAYRPGSKQRVIKEVTCKRIRPVLMKERGGICMLQIDDHVLYIEECEAFARADGFSDFYQFWDYFKSQGLPFKGSLIEW